MSHGTKTFFLVFDLASQTINNNYFWFEKLNQNQTPKIILGEIQSKSSPNIMIKFRNFHNGSEFLKVLMSLRRCNEVK